MNKKITIISIITILIDQITKILAKTYLTRSIVVIPDFFYLTFAKNTGAAWSIMKNQRLLLVILSIVILYILFRFSYEFKENKRNNFAFALLYGGIIGNLINRIIDGSVIDFLDFKIFNYDFPIFNVADIAIVIGIILIIGAIIRGEDKCK